MALTWVVSHCPHVWYIAKVDDDVLVNTYNIVRFIKQQGVKLAEKAKLVGVKQADVKLAGGNVSGLLSCKVPQQTQVQRKERDKWYVHRREYPFDIYPPWCFGYGILMTRDVAEKLLDTSRDIRSYWIDDVYVTGLLRFHAHLSITTLPTYLHQSSHAQHKSEKFAAIFVLHNFTKNNTFLNYWKQLVAINDG